MRNKSSDYFNNIYFICFWYIKIKSCIYITFDVSFSIAIIFFLVFRNDVELKRIFLHANSIVDNKTCPGVSKFIERTFYFVFAGEFHSLYLKQIVFHIKQRLRDKMIKIKNVSRITEYFFFLEFVRWIILSH